MATFKYYLQPKRKITGLSEYETIDIYQYNVYFKAQLVIEKLPDKTLVDAGGYSEVAKTYMKDQEIFLNVDGWRTRHYKIIGDELYMKEISAGVWDHGEVNKFKWNGKRWQKVRALPETNNNTGKALERNKFL